MDKERKNPRCLLPRGWDSILQDWFHEDTPSFDFGGHVVGSRQTKAFIFQKAEGVIAGLPFLEKIFEFTGCEVLWKVEEGTYFDPSTCQEGEKGKGRICVGTVTGPANAVLQAERIALNVLCRASGIATVCYRLSQIAKQHGWKGKVAGTRKTTPGFRLVEKYAMLVGGVDTHRMDLSSMIMLKDNHIVTHGSITRAVKSALDVGGFAIKVEVECQNEEEAREALEAGAHIVMLDNFSPPDAKVVAKSLKNSFPFAIIEVSGGITGETLSNFFCDSIDVLSTSSTSQSVPHIDFSMKILKEENQEE